MSFIKSSPSSDFTKTPDGSFLVFSPTFTFSGTITIPVPTITMGEFEEPAPSSFDITIEIPVPIVTGTFSRAYHFAGTITIPVPIVTADFNRAAGFEISLQIPLQEDGDLSSSPSEEALKTPDGSFLTFETRLIRGHFSVTQNNFSINITTPAPVVMGIFDIVKSTFSGSLILPVPNINVTFDDDQVREFGIGLTLPTAIVTGSFYRINPLTIIFSNHGSPSNFSNNNLNTLIDSICGLATNEDISGGGAYDSINAVDGSDISDSQFRSISIRRPNLSNIRQLQIASQRQKSMSGLIRTYIDTPVDYKISLTWTLFNCDNRHLNNLIGLIYFRKIRYVDDQNVWELTLRSDVYQLIHESRHSNSLTLEFIGKKIS